MNIPENARVINSDDRNDDIGDKDAKGEVVVDEACWIYEHLRYALPTNCTRTLIIFF